jgi:hypothetical protein
MFKKLFAKKTADGKNPVPFAEFIIAAAVLMFFEAFLLYNFFVKPQTAAAAASREALYERREALAQYRANKRDSAGLAGQLADLEARITDAEKKLPAALHNEDISIMIGDFANKFNVSVESVAFQERQLAVPSEYASSGAGTSDAGISPVIGAVSGGTGGSGVVAPGTGGTGAASPEGTQNGVGAEAYPALLGDAPSPAGRTLSLQGVQISFNSEFHTAGPFIKLFEDSERSVRVKSASLTRVQEDELKGVLNLEFASLSPDAERNYPGLNVAAGNGGGPAKDSLFRKYNGFVEDNVDPTILLLSEEDDYDPDFYVVLKASSSNETKVSYGVYPRVETELRSNVNNAVRAKLTIGGDEEQFDYIYSLAAYQKSEKRKPPLCCLISYSL